MNKKIFFIFLIILVVLGYVFNIDRIISNKITPISLDLKSSYSKNILYVSNLFDTYINQTEQISYLQNQVSQNNNYKILYETSQKELVKFQNIFLDKNNTIKVNFVKVLSYINLNNFSKVILDTNLSKEKKILALVTPENYSAGIVLRQDNKTVSYLNTNSKCNYAVFIGDKKAPGITSGITKNGKLILKYVPKWHKINIGDEVVTSGQDDIFPFGLKVGRVIEVKELANTQNVIIQSYANVLSKKYFYIINIDTD
ncbi:MAG TPA: rod shape-determining protein MreC [Arcobacter sp.]|nr:rod shape-determining protein MreC [Arcobacter sp.]HIP56366.1 rod shape-determining protein MreC [Arcobacter sp.]